MSDHAWERELLAPEQRDEDGNVIPAVWAWLRCRRCRGQACQVGTGSRAKFYFRETSEAEWGPMVDACRFVPQPNR